MGGRLDGKVAIVTEASAGIGWASARVLAEEGASLVITARRQGRLDELAEELRGLGVSVGTVAGDAHEEETAMRNMAESLA